MALRTCLKSLLRIESVVILSSPSYTAMRRPPKAKTAASYPNAVPVLDIKIVAEGFSKKQWMQDSQDAALPDHFTANPGFFLAQVIGESMNRRIPNGSWRLFREASDGSSNAKVVIVQSRDIQDPDTCGQYTVKVYRSEKAETKDPWPHLSIRLEPKSNDREFQPLLF